jgi:hypothetical protein
MYMSEPVGESHGFNPFFWTNRIFSGTTHDPSKRVHTTASYGAYRMSEQEKKFERGQLLAEREDVNEQINDFRRKARRFSDSWEIVTKRLSFDLENLVFQNEQTPLQFRGPLVPDASTLDVSVVLEMRDSLRALLLRKKILDATQ